MFHSSLPSLSAERKFHPSARFLLTNWPTSVPSSLLESGPNGMVLLKISSSPVFLPSHPTSPRMSFPNFVPSLFPAALQHAQSSPSFKKENLFPTFHFSLPTTLPLLPSTTIKLLKKSYLHSFFPFPL